MSADEVKEKFAGKWKEVRNENLDAFLTDFGESSIIVDLSYSIVDQ